LSVTRGQGLLLVGLAVAAVAVWVVLLGQVLGGREPAPSPDVAVIVTDPPSTATPVASPSTTTAAPTEASTPPPDPTDPPTDAPTDAPAVGSGGRPAFLAFLARMDAARASAEDLNADLRDAGEAGDEAAVRSTAADMDALVTSEREWLAGNPPDPCYADAHAAADDLIAAYGAVAAAADAWADASGLDVLAALAQLYDAVEAAAGEAADLGPALEGASCPA
jgi:hypothetical protein